MATHPTHGVHLRQRHSNRWLLVAIVVAAALLAVGAWALVDHYTGGTAETTTEQAPLASTAVANKYIAALDKLAPYSLTPILAKNVVSTDRALGSGPPFRSAKTLERVWAGVFTSSGDAYFRGTLHAAAPSWAAVTWRLRGSTNPLTSEPFTLNGLSILNIENAKIVRETYYWDVPGRKPGVAGTVGRKFATALAGHRFGWGRTLRSLYGPNAVEIPVGAAPSPHKDLIWGRWAMPSFMPLHASLCCAGPSSRLDNGTTRLSWAVVNWVAQDASPGGSKVPGISILQLKNGKIIRETMYY